MTNTSSEQTPQKRQQSLLSRRNFLKFLGVGAGVAAVSKAPHIISHSEEIADTLTFLTERKTPTESEIEYVPEDPNIFLKPEFTDRIYHTLKLEEKFPTTLDVEIFQAIAQKVSRNLGLYFTPSQELKTQIKNELNGKPFEWFLLSAEHRTALEREFAQFCEQHFQKMMNLCEQMQVDFVACLLVWQTSGQNTSSRKAYGHDIRDEQIRSMLSLLEATNGQASTSTLVSTMRRMKMEAYFPMARLEGPVTVGIHDIEIIMICRSLANLKSTNPEQWDTIRTQLTNKAPEFMDSFEHYVETYDLFEQTSDLIENEIAGSQDIQEYISSLATKETIYTVITSNGVTDDYQFLRTTTFWANICRLQAEKGMSAYVTDVEGQALMQTVQKYLTSPKLFFLEQISNPKFEEVLKTDAQKGNQTAQHLLDISQRFDQVSDQIIQLDRDIAAKLVHEGTEQDIEFQLVTGVAYMKWLLNEVKKTTGQGYMKEIHFTDPNQLAYESLLAVSNRESGALSLLTGRPLSRATLPFADGNTQIGLMREFANTVYPQFETQPPEKNFKPFLITLLKLLEEFYIPRLTGVHRFELEEDKKTVDLVKAAEQFGFYQKIITPPYNSWVVAIQSCVSYAAKILKS